MKVKFTPVEFQAPAIRWVKAPAFQVPWVRVRELVTVQAPVEFTTSPAADLLISRSKKLLALTDTGVVVPFSSSLVPLGV